MQPHPQLPAESSLSLSIAHPAQSRKLSAISKSRGRNGGRLAGQNGSGVGRLQSDFERSGYCTYEDAMCERLGRYARELRSLHSELQQFATRQSFDVQSSCRSLVRPRPAVTLRRRRCGRDRMYRANQSLSIQRTPGAVGRQPSTSTRTHTRIPHMTAATIRPRNNLAAFRIQLCDFAKGNSTQVCSQKTGLTKRQQQQHSVPFPPDVNIPRRHAGGQVTMKRIFERKRLQREQRRQEKSAFYKQKVKEIYDSFDKVQRSLRYEEDEPADALGLSYGGKQNFYMQ